ncbi:MAG: HAMP domain-containing protein [Betaproteobacteria bacterium]|nr:MAG: HAMP domain-containing protein [Betaproteobacteria bacterium]
MMRMPLPRSLKGRLLLLLIGGLVAAQVASSLIAYYDRRASIERVLARRNAVRVADLIRMLDGMGAAGREPAVAALRYPVIRLGPLAVPRADGMPEETIGRETVEGPIAEAMTTAFRERLRPPRAAHIRVGQTKLRYSPESGFVPAPGIGSTAQFGWGVSVRSVLADGTPVVVYVEIPQAILFSVSSLLWQFFLLSAVTIVLVALAVNSVTRPLSELADAAERLGNDLDAPPLREHGASELRRAAHAFNSMQDRLSRYLKSRVNALSAISHDLKTPITRMRLRAELIEDPPLRESLLRDMSELEKMVRSALEFIRGLDSTEPPQPTDINALIDSVCEDYREAGHEVAIEGAATQPYPAQTQALKHCLSNIVDNACKYGGKARIVVKDSDRELVIKVRDFGHGVPEAELEKVFQPFYRLETSRSRDTGGTGLGLAIARNVAQLHHGQMRIRNHPEGGLEAILALPRA